MCRDCLLVIYNNSRPHCAWHTLSNHYGNLEHRKTEGQMCFNTKFCCSHLGPNKQTSTQQFLAKKYPRIAEVSVSKALEPEGGLELGGNCEKPQMTFMIHILWATQLLIIILSLEEGAPHPCVLSQWQSQSYGKTEVLPLHPAGKMFSIPVSENKNYRAPNKTHPKTHLKRIHSAGKKSVFNLEQGLPLYPFPSFLHFIFILL